MFTARFSLNYFVPRACRKRNFSLSAVVKLQPTLNSWPRKHLSECRGKLAAHEFQFTEWCSIQCTLGCARYIWQ